MNRTLLSILGAAVIGLAVGTAHAGQFVVELPAPMKSPSPDQLESHGVTLDQTFSAGADSYAVFTAENQSALEALLESTMINAKKISAVLFVNSPEVGGGKAAGAEPQPGHEVFVIERGIPGVGSLPLEKQQEISRGSNAANTTLGSIIEWDHSYLTDEGTYCVYRAASSDAVREQGRLSGAPVDKITAVQHRIY